jgi:hypothetical protein
MKLAAGTPEQQRRQLLILAVVLVIGVVLYSQYGGFPTAEVPPRASNTPAAGGVKAPTPPSGTAQLPEALKLGALVTVSEETAGTRDPFGFGIPPRPPAPPPPPPVVRQAPPPEPPPRPVGPPPRPQIPVKFLGFAEDPNRPGKLVFLSVNGTVVLAREGEVVDGRYRLVKVGLETIVMAYLDGQGQQTIRQSGS